MNLLNQIKRLLIMLLSFNIISYVISIIISIFIVINLYYVHEQYKDIRKELNSVKHIINDNLTILEYRIQKLNKLIDKDIEYRKKLIKLNSIIIKYTDNESD